jgi:hypothetical protein
LIFEAWLASFGFTLVVELPLFVGLSRRWVSAPRAALVGAGGTALTHPMLWFVWSRLLDDYVAYIVAGELLVASVEAALFYWLARPGSWGRAVGVAFIANAASYLLGAVIGG